jgi:hypothetical protein
VDADRSTAATFTQSWLLGIRTQALRQASPKIHFFLQHADSGLGNSSQFLKRLHLRLLSKMRATATDDACNSYRPRKPGERRMCTKPSLPRMVCGAIVREFKPKPTKEGVSHDSTERSEISLSQTE